MNHLPWSFFPVSGCKLSCSPSSVVWQVPPGQGPVLIFAVLEQLLYLPHSCDQTFPGSKLWQQEQLLAHCTCSWWLRAPAGVKHKVAATVIFCCFLSLMREGSWRFFYPTNAIYCQKQPRDWAVHGLIISSSASFLCCWWSAPNLSKDRLFVSEAQCVASGWGRYSEVLGINTKCKRNKKLVCPCNSSCFLYCWNLQCLDGNQWNYYEIIS